MDDETFKPFPGIGPPPSREDTLGTLERPPAKKGRRKKSGRTEQLNIRVQPGMEERFNALAEREQADERRLPGEAACRR